VCGNLQIIPSYICLSFNNDVFNDIKGLKCIEIILKFNTCIKFIDFQSSDFIFDEKELFYKGLLKTNSNRISIKFNYNQIKNIINCNNSNINKFISITLGNIIIGDKKSGPKQKNNIFYYKFEDRNNMSINGNYISFSDIFGIKFTLL